MSENKKQFCPECGNYAQDEALARRDFMKMAGGGVASLAALGTVGATSLTAAVDAPAAAPAKQAGNRVAEDLIRELFSGLTAEQKRNVCYAWDHGAAGGAMPTRLRMVNAPIGRRIADAYTRPQQELVERIVRSMLNGDEGYNLISRNNTWDGSRNIQGCGAYIFGEPTENRQFSFYFCGHHLTMRCDGNSEPGAAFGGPMYYGHSADGNSRRNVFHYQTRSALNFFDSLTEAQRRMAIVQGSPGEQIGSVRHRENGFPGIPAGELTRDQVRLVEQIMRDVLSPYRRQDGDEVMDIVRRNGGLERINLAFYRDREGDGDWHFWRLEGPGFVWNYRVLPHVHTFVHIRSRA